MTSEHEVINTLCFLYIYLIPGEGIGGNSEVYAFHMKDFFFALGNQLCQGLLESG